MLPDGWKILALEDIAERKSGHTPDKDVARFWNGGIKWVSLADSGRLDKGLITRTDKEISDDGIRNSSAVLLPAGTVVLSRDAGVGKSAVLAYPMAVSQHFIAWNCAGSAELYNWYLYYWLQSKKPEFERVANGSTIKTIGLPYFKKLKVIVPPISEQRRISEILSAWDASIAATEKLLLTSRREKRALMAQLLSGKRRLVPNDGQFLATPYGPIPADWSYPRIETFAREVNVRNGAGQPHVVLSCTKHSGLVDSLTYFNKQIFSKDVSTYKVVPRGAFAYATNHIEEGSIGYQDLYDFGLVSPMYTVFHTTAAVDDTYLYRLLKTEHLRQKFAAATNSSVDRRGSLRWNDFKKLHVPLPPLDEQKAIAAVLETVDKEVATLQRQLECLCSEKSALMQQLLTGKRRARLLEIAEMEHA